MPAACAATARQYDTQEATAKQHVKDCRTVVEQATEVIRTTMPLPFGRWKRIRRAQREVIRTNTDHRTHWADERAKARERRTYAESRLPAHAEAVTRPKQRLVDGERINAEIARVWERLTPAQHEMVQQEDAAHRQREQAQEQAEEHRRKREQALWPAYEPPIKTAAKNRASDALNKVGTSPVKCAATVLQMR